MPLQGFKEIAPSEMEILKVASHHQQLQKEVDREVVDKLPTPNQPTNVFHTEVFEPTLDDSDILFSSVLMHMGNQVQVQITKHKLVIQCEIPALAVSIDLYREVYGASIGKQNPKEFSIFSLIAHKEKKTITFECKDEQESKHIMKLINHLVWHVPENTTELPKRRMLIIINPHSGGQTACSQFRANVKPLLDDVKDCISYEVIFTEGSKHTSLICRDADICEWDAICCAGGDGTLSECLNGLMMRDDWEKAIKTPLIPFPMGTTNAMAKSLFGTSPSNNLLLISAFAAVRGFYKPIDIMSVWQKGKRMYAILNLSFGFLANVVHKGEMLREFKIGEARNSIGAIREVIEKNYYRCRLSYVKFEDELTETMPETVSQTGDYIITNSKEKLLHIKQRQCIYQNLIDQVCINGKSKEVIIPKEVNVDAAKRALEPYASHEEGPPCPLLAKYFPDFTNSPGTRAVSDHNIITIEDDFFTILCANINNVQENRTLPPTVYQNSEYLDLLWGIKDERVGRLEISKCLLSSIQNYLENHLVLDYDIFQFDRTQCIKVEPLQEGSFVSIDGEAGNYGPTYIELHKGLANMIVL